MQNVVLYHVTEKNNYEKISREGFKLPVTDWGHFWVGKMKKKPGSLGFGIYGFLENKELAKDFWQLSMHGKVDDSEILKIDVKFENDECLNFVDGIDEMDFFRYFLLDPKVCKQISNINKFYKNTKGQHSLDGALLEFFIKKLQEKGSLEKITCVCCATTTNLYPKFATCIPNGVEYCLRDSKIIENIERIEKD